MIAFIYGKKSDGLKVTSCGFLRRRVSKLSDENLLWRCSTWGEDVPMHLRGTWCHWGQQRWAWRQESWRLLVPEGWGTWKANGDWCAIHSEKRVGRSWALQQTAVASVGSCWDSNCSKVAAYFLALTFILTNCNFTLRKKKRATGTLGIFNQITMKKSLACKAKHAG